MSKSVSALNEIRLKPKLRFRVFEPFRVETRVGRIFHPWVVGEEVAGPVQGRLGAADFFGGGFIVRDVELFKPELILGVLRFVVSNPSFQFRMLGTGRGISAGAFVAP